MSQNDLGAPCCVVSPKIILLKPKYKYTVLLCKKILETIDKMELVYVLQEDSRNDR